MTKITIRKVGDINGNILSVLTSDWQTVSIIACQVVLPPDAVKRMISYKKQKPGRWGASEPGIRSDLVCQRLKAMIDNGVVEKRKIGNKNEYRLAQPKSEED